MKASGVKINKIWSKLVRKMKTPNVRISTRLKKMMIRQINGVQMQIKNKTSITSVNNLAATKTKGKDTKDRSNFLLF